MQTEPSEPGRAPPGRRNTPTGDMLVLEGSSLRTSSALGAGEPVGRGFRALRDRCLVFSPGSVGDGAGTDGRQSRSL
jgi:hypothetical protein